MRWTECKMGQAQVERSAACTCWPTCVAGIIAAACWLDGATDHSMVDISRTCNACKCAADAGWRGDHTAAHPALVHFAQFVGQSQQQARPGACSPGLQAGRGKAQVAAKDP